MPNRLEIIYLVMSNFAVDRVYTEAVEGSGVLRVFVPGIDKGMQIAIHEFLGERIPAGVRLDVHRTEPPDSLKDVTFKEPKRTPLPKRDPKWK